MTTRTRSSAPSAPRRRSTVRSAGFIGLAGLLAWAVIGLPFLVFPPIGPLPEHADVIVVLGPDTPGLVALSERLFAQGVAPAMLWSTPTMPSATSKEVLEACGRRRGCSASSPTPAPRRARRRSRHAWRGPAGGRVPS